MAARKIFDMKALAVSLMTLTICWMGLDLGKAQATTVPGDLDKTFGGTGWVASAPPPQSTNEAYAVAVQADGKIVAAGARFDGNNPKTLVAVRFLSNGTVDSSFGSGGVVDLLAGTATEGYSVAVQPWDQKIVVAGTAYSNGKSNFFAARLCTNGSLDNGTNCGSGGFGSGGSITLPALQAGAAYESGTGGVVVQPDHKFLILGNSKSSTGFHRTSLAVARLCENGAWDNGVNCGAGGFGGGKGFVLTPSPVSASNFAYDKSLALQPDGKIIAAGTDSSTGISTGQFLLVRYCSNGTLDNGTNCGTGGFGSGGFVTTAIPGGAGNDWSSGVVLQSDGKIVVAGSSGSSALSAGYVVALVRYCANGELDDAINCGGTGFGSGGISTLTAYGAGSYVNGLVLQPDGKLIVLGSNIAPPYPPSSAILLRYTTGGFLDTTFGNDGGSLTLFQSGSEVFNFLNAGAMQADGKIVVAGRISDNTSGNEQFLVARYLGDGPFMINATVKYDTGGKISCTPANPVIFGDQVDCTMEPSFLSPGYYHITDVSAGPSGAAVSVGPTTKYTFSDVFEDKDIQVTYAKTDIWLYRKDIIPPFSFWNLLATDHTIADALLDVALWHKDTNTIRMPTGAYAESGGVFCYETLNTILSGGWNSETSRDASPMSTVAGPLTITNSCSLTIDGITVE